MAVQNRTAAEAADSLEMSRSAVRQAKYRVLKRLRQELSALGRPRMAANDRPTSRAAYRGLPKRPLQLSPRLRLAESAESGWPRIETFSNATANVAAVALPAN